MALASRELILKAMKLTCLFLEKKRLTVKDVTEELGITTRCAHGWLMAASIALPIYSPNEEMRRVTEPIIYELLMEDFKLYDKSERIVAGMRHFEKRKENRHNHKAKMIGGVDVSKIR